LDGGVTGAVIIVIVLLIMPVLICMSLAVVAGLIGWFLKDDVASEYPPDSEYVELGG
jgi:hypothetical protein